MLQIDDNRRVTSFAEKPKGAALDAMKVRRVGRKGGGAWDWLCKACNACRHGRG